MSKLIYIADPMCSWCYGFGPELATLLNGLPGIPLTLMVGGLRPYNTKPMDDALRTTLKSHWAKVSERTGLPFNDKGLDTPGFVYDTEPACRAVTAIGLLAPQLTMEVFGAIQRAFYVKALDVTQGNVLADIAVRTLEENGIALERASFLQTWSSQEAVTATSADFKQVQQWGVAGFPTLILEHGGNLHLVASGFARTEELIVRMQGIVDEATTG